MNEETNHERPAVETLKSYLHVALETLARARREYEQQKARWKAFQETETYTSMKEPYDEARAAMKEADEQVRSDALKLYMATGEKQVHDAVTVKSYTNTEVDWSKATEWCKENAPAFLTVDKKAFLAYLDSVDEPPDFVTIEEDPRPTVASDLSGLLEDGES